MTGPMLIGLSLMNKKHALIRGIDQTPGGRGLNITVQWLSHQPCSKIQPTHRAVGVRLTFAPFLLSVVIL